ncbi:S41 family peptidase [Mycoplasma simbae]|uniref:S41 family peptidase n=1 Tax=Mycoplasma simbae TaxID=36744 RepID=UPI0004957005|nr:S41 family peptidase [Mycoplasma simbae]
MKNNNQSKTNKSSLKKFILSSSLATSFVAGSFIAVSCSNLPKTTEKTHVELLKFKDFDFENKSAEYKIEGVKLQTFKDKKTDDLYVNINEFLSKLHGIFDTSDLKYTRFEDGKYYYNLGENVMIFDDKDNKVFMSSTDAFQMVKKSSTTDYLRHLNYTDFELKRLSKDKYAELNLGAYGMSIKAIDDNIFMPFSIFNLLFLSQNYYNIYFNNDKFIGTTTTVNKDISAEEYNAVMTNSRNNTSPSEKERVNNYNFIRFIFDHFYGLNKAFLAKHNASDFEQYFASRVVNSQDESIPEAERTKTLKERLLSTNVSEFTHAYEDFIYRELDELHTSIQSASYFHPKDFRAHPSASALSSKVNQYINSLNTLSRIRSRILGGDRVNNFVNFYNDIAIIYLDKFSIGTDEQLKQEDAFKHDTFTKMVKAMEQIEERSKTEPVKRIILDLSLNGGGSIAAMEKVAAFLTNKEQKLYFYETVNKLLAFSKYRVDVNQDGIYDDKDGYPEYEWIILTGLNTFSAANLLTHIAKETKTAKIIGNKSGGGMYSILPFVLPDGTSFEFSSNNAWTSWTPSPVNTEADLPYTQDGIDVEIQIPYLAYSNYEVIDAYLTNPQLGEQKYNKWLRDIKVSAWNSEKERINKYLPFIKNTRKKAEYENTLAQNAIDDSDDLDQIQTKIENLQELFRFVEFEYTRENR